MRQSITSYVGGTFQPQEHPSYRPQHQALSPTTSAVGWKSPVPYLFGGLAAMLGLIAFALLILACSYWKLSGHLDAGQDSGDFSGHEKSKDAANATSKPLQNSILVIMAGDEKPTFLATPATSRLSSFGDSEGDNNGGGSSSSSSEDDSREKMIEAKMMIR